MIDIRRAATTRLLDPVVWTLIKRVPLMARLKEFRAQQFDDVETFRLRQERKLEELLLHAAGNIPFYRERLSGITHRTGASNVRAALVDIEPLSKRDLREHLDDMVVEMGRGTMVDASGGSTGEPTRFYKDREQLGASLAMTQVYLEWAGIERGEPHVKLWGARRDLRDRVSLGLRLNRYFYGRRTLDAFEMGEATMREYLSIMERTRAVCVEGYADALDRLAAFVEERGLAMAPVRAVVSSASTLHLHMRERIERVFGAPVFDRYGGREVSGIAAECSEHCGLHTSGETVFVEVVDGEGRPVEQGEEGEVLVTGLWNYTMPLIRYRIGDRAVLGSEHCACGRPYPLLERIIGRSSASLRRSDGGSVVPAFFIHLIGVEFNDGELLKFQVIQENLDTIRVRLVPKPGAQVRILARREALTKRIRSAMGASCRVIYTIEEDIEPTPTGKHLYTVSRLADEAGGAEGVGDADAVGGAGGAGVVDEAGGADEAT
ncbi:hypothetical protein K8S17_02715 [bacterium]|nr:hypothetical protein [bacterium]